MLFAFVRSKRGKVLKLSSLKHIEIVRNTWACKYKIPFESTIYSLLKSINASYNNYTKNILDLQKTTIVTPKDGTHEINSNDLKYESNYASKINNYVFKLNSSKQLFVNQLQTLFSLEEQLFHIIKHDLVKHYSME